MTSTEEQTVPSRPPGVLAPEYRALTIGMVALITLVAFESLAVTTAMPTVAQALDGLSLYALAFGGPLASAVVAMVVSGTWSDLKGPTRPLWHGTAWFLTGLLIAGFAPTMEVLVVGRVIQGFGSGLLIVALYVVVGHLYPAALRPRIFAAFATGWVVPSLVGPAIAGLIVEHTNWRIVFLAVPVLAVPATLVMRPGLAKGDHPQTSGKLWSKRAWWAVAAAAGVLMLHYGGQQHGVQQLVLVIAGLVAVGAFGPKLLPKGTFAIGAGLPAVIALRGLVAAAGFGAEVFLPLMLTRERGLSPAFAGMVLTVSALSWTAASWYRGRPNQPFPHHVFLQAGMVSLMLGILTAAATLDERVPVLVGVLGWGLAGLGMGTVFPTLSVLVLEYSSREQQGANTSAMQLSDSLLTATVLAVGGSLFAAIEPHSPTTAYLTAFGLPAALGLLGVLAARRTRA
ncbi:major facilitator superfamily MFS_1 [Kribbella flavida DSM 17836]|uniref:Major facilitator superfamily MFS_1 n=1 Tax=Kribbella flavida (strain DSM 17836 / JCM 10339 / NBRC 14399) TaxID=479435 RepID=D2Q2K2_KRIFD|nr:MFS transporter [Kribbella flavida]ADB35898.1 major facilitator superfamily MFS_1 [Kribbella flavida DSM 17836]